MLPLTSYSPSNHIKLLIRAVATGVNPWALRSYNVTNVLLAHAHIYQPKVLVRLFNVLNIQYGNKVHSFYFNYYFILEYNSGEYGQVFLVVVILY